MQTLIALAGQPSQPLTARRLAGGLAAILFAASVWYGLPQLDAAARSALIIYGLAVGAWVWSPLEETTVALTALLALALTGVISSESMFHSLGNSLIGLLLAAFIVAAAANATGLCQWLVTALTRRARSVRQLCYGLTAANLITALFIPATSARAALMAPVFLALSEQLNQPRLSKALALVLPTAILLTAAASLTGAGAHLLTADLIVQFGGERLDFLRWLMLGLPFALLSSFLSTEVILQLFLTAEERRRTVAVENAGPADHPPQPLLDGSARYVLSIIGVMVALWATSSLHGLDNTLVAVFGALAVTWPGLGPISLKQGLKAVEWNLLIFMAATLELSESLIQTGAAAELARTLFTALETRLAGSPLLLAGGVAIIGLLSHLLIASRSARATILIPAVILFALSLGYEPTALAFSAALASGYCLTLTVSAKPVALFAQLPAATYGPRDLLRLSGALLPLHLGLLLLFSWLIWPALGLKLT